MRLNYLLFNKEEISRMVELVSCCFQSLRVDRKKREGGKY